MMRKRTLLMGLAVSAAVALILGSLLFWMVGLLSRQLRDQRVIEANYRYLNFNNNFENFIISHSNILYGFSAYINTFDDLDDDDIYTFLDELLRDNREFIRNVGILKDTTILWNFPREGNSAAIGIDLAEIESQASPILAVKNRLIRVFHGPVNLVQGGTGYIIRIPLVRNGSYWGQASIVLDGDSFTAFMDRISEEAGLRVLLREAGGERIIMYGDPGLLEKNPTRLTRDTDFGQWEVAFVLREPEGNPAFSSIVIVAILGSLITLGLSLFSFRYTVGNIQIRHKNQSLSLTAMTDRLTGIYNREMLESYIYEEIERAERLGSDMSLILFDLDHFKRVNDTFGHDAGDSVLVNTAARAREIIRKNDLFVRWGGEEFLIIIPGGNLNTATKIAEKLRTGIGGLAFAGVGNVTISLGVAERREYEFWGSWFERADRALYQAKEEGRNRIAISMESEPIKKKSRNLDWKNEWFCGNSAINQQHKQLMLDANRLIEAFADNPEAFLPMYDRFIDSLQRHFRYEEGILQKKNYPFLEEHMSIHSHIMNSIRRTRDNMDNYINSSESLLDYILDEILVGHFLKEDFKFFNYLA